MKGFAVRGTCGDGGGSARLELAREVEAWTRRLRRSEFKKETQEQQSGVTVAVRATRDPGTALRAWGNRWLQGRERVSRAL